MGKMDEMILVAPRDDVFKKESLTFQGVNSEDSKVAEIMAQIEAGYREMRRETQKKIRISSSRSLMSSLSAKMKFSFTNGWLAAENRVCTISFLSALEAI